MVWYSKMKKIAIMIITVYKTNPCINKKNWFVWIFEPNLKAFLTNKSKIEANTFAKIVTYLIEWLPMERFWIPWLQLFEVLLKTRANIWHQYLADFIFRSSEKSTQPNLAAKKCLQSGLPPRKRLLMIGHGTTEYVHSREYISQILLLLWHQLHL